MKTAGLFLIGLGSVLEAAGASVEKLGYRLYGTTTPTNRVEGLSYRDRNGTKPARIRFPRQRGRTG